MQTAAAFNLTVHSMHKHMIQYLMYSVHGAAVFFTIKSKSYNIVLNKLKAW